MRPFKGMSKTLLDEGFVRLGEKDFLGGDLTVVNSARISFAKQHDQMEEGDDKLINYLMKHRHGTPFEQSMFRFHVKCPIFVAREWMRHRIASYNEVSGRYTKLEPQYYVPAGEAVRTQKGKAGHYRMEPILDPAKQQEIRQIIVATCENALTKYDRLLELGLAKEVARDVLPVNMYTEFYFAVNARSLMNFISLRAHETALYEIRVYAQAIEKMFAKCMPVSYNCFVQNGRVAP